MFSCNLNLKLLMKFKFCFHFTPLCYAVEKNDFEIVELLLSCEKLDVNLKSI